MVRPHAIDFLRWCKDRGHAISLWTKAHSAWADHVRRTLCQLVANDDHQCSQTCRRIFEFVWSGNKVTRRCLSRACSEHFDDGGTSCRWCEVYSRTCRQCYCYFYSAHCPCRDVKDLRKVWYSSEKETDNFTKERTLIVENTPQNCIYNYGNALYVPTYRGGSCEEDSFFLKMQVFVERELETSTNVRHVRKCRHGDQYHACYEQYWTEEVYPQDRTWSWVVLWSWSGSVLW